ncbi:MAG: pilus assembly protein PilM [Acidobacteria bacterium]|nr:pilus assembly protein PilM [Acidobacteriota bacterium]
MSITSWLASPPPDAAVEIAPARVSAAAMMTRGDRPTIQAYAAEALPAGAVAASLTTQNVVDRAAVAAGVRTVLSRLGTRPRRVALIIPDLAAKVSVIRFDHVPARHDDLDQLVRWQVRKAAPFPIEDACVTYTPGARGADGSGDFVVALARHDVVRGYEEACADAGVYAGLVDLATFSVVNLALASARTDGGDWLVVHMRPEYTSIAIVRAGDLIFFRNRPDDDDETLADVVHQTVMYYQDRLAGRGFARVLLGGSGRAAGAVAHARQSLEERLGTAVEAIDPTGAAIVPDRLTATPDLMDVLAPLTGMLLRTRAEGVRT